MSNDDIHGLSGAYAVDAVDDVERARFEAHLAGCAECEIEVASMRAAAGEMSAMTLTAPPASLRAAVLRDITSVRPLPPRVTLQESPATDLTAPPAPPASPAGPTVIRDEGHESPESTTTSEPSSLDSKRADRARRAPLRQWLVGVAAAAVLVTGGVVWQPWSSDTSTVQLTAMDQVLQAKDAQTFDQKVADGTVKIVRSPSLKKAVIVTANMPAAPTGKVYELWLQQGTEMVGAGLMPAGQANTVLLEGNAASASAVGITVEPAGGSKSPTLPAVALISLA